MLIAEMSVAGGVGKSTLDKNWLSAILGARRAAVEEINRGDGTPDLKVTLAEFEDLVVLLKKNEHEHVVIDIGASSTANGLQHVLARYKRTLASVDFWVIPVIGNEHALDGAIQAVRILREQLAVPASRIVVIPNRVSPGTTPQNLVRQFGPVYALRKIGVFVSDVPVFEHQIFEHLKDQTRDGKDETVYSVAGDTRDFRALKKAAREARDERALDDLADREVKVEAAEFAVENLNAVWAATPMANALAAKSV
jgi:hypothetical protein